MVLSAAVDPSEFDFIWLPEEPADVEEPDVKCVAAERGLPGGGTQG